MTQTDTFPPDTLSASPVARLAWILLILATLYLCYFLNLGAIGFVGPDEPRYAWIARDMAETGDWVTPRLYGKPWFEKPPLYYWGAALSFKLFGVSEAAARFPCALAALFATLAMAWLAWRTYGAETARWLLLLLPTTVGMIGFSHAAATDMPFAAMLTIAMVFAARLLGLIPTSESSASFTSSTSFNSLFLGAFLGLAVLAKGPAAIILSGGAVFLWAAFTKRWRDGFRCLHPVAIASFCLTAPPWYILCARSNSDFFRVFIIEHNFKRYLTPEFQHIQPFWFYIPILLIAFAPWTLVFLWSALYGSLRHLPLRRTSSATLLLLCWSAFCLVFFSISKSKLPGYILPSIPAIGLLLVRSYIGFSARLEKTFRWQVYAWSGLAIPASLLLLFLGHNFSTSRTNSKLLLVVGIVLLLFTLANICLTFKLDSRWRGFDPAALCVIPVFTLLAMFQFLSSHWLLYDPSGKTLAAELQARRIPPEKIYAGHMQRGQQFSLSFYLHHEITEWNPDSPKGGYLLLNGKKCQAYVREPWKCDSDPVLLGASGWFVFNVDREPSGGGLSGFGALGGDHNLGNAADRQPR